MFISKVDTSQEFLMKQSSDLDVPTGKVNVI